jgi:hypothetical protein
MGGSYGQFIRPLLYCYKGGVVFQIGPEGLELIFAVIPFPPPYPCP